MKNSNPLKSADVKTYLSDVLVEVRDYSAWIAASDRFLLYSELINAQQSPCFFCPPHPNRVRFNASLNF